MSSWARAAPGQVSPVKHPRKRAKRRYFMSKLLAWSWTYRRADAVPLAGSFCRPLQLLVLCVQQRLVAHQLTVPAHVDLPALAVLGVLLAEDQFGRFLDVLFLLRFHLVVLAVHEVAID